MKKSEKDSLRLGVVIGGIIGLIVYGSQQLNEQKKEK